MNIIAILIIPCVNSSLSEKDQYESDNDITNVKSNAQLIRLITNKVAFMKKTSDDENNGNATGTHNNNKTRDASNTDEKNACQDDDNKPSSSTLLNEEKVCQDSNNKPTYSISSNEEKVCQDNDNIPLSLLSKENNTFSQNVQMREEKNTFISKLKESGIRPINSNKHIVKHKYIHISTKKIHINMLCLFWHVSYGHYKASEKNRLHIQYNDQTLVFMKENIFEMSIMPYDDIITFINITYRRSKYYRNTCVFMIPQTNSHCSNVQSSNRQRHCIPYDDDWFSKMANGCKKSSNALNLLEALKKKMDDCKNIDIRCVNSKDTFIYLIRNADVFFELLSVNSNHFKSVDIHDMYHSQLDMLFVQNVSTKLFVFPELLSLYKHCDTIKSVHHDKDNKHKMCIGYYVLGRFERFIEHFKISLLSNETSDLHRIDIAFLKTYIVELYFTYLFSACFRINYQCIIMYVFMNKLQTVSVCNADLFTCNLIEFMLYNLLDLNLKRQSKFASQLIDKLLKKKERNVIVNELLHILLRSNWCIFKDVTDDIITNMDSMQRGCISKKKVMYIYYRNKPVSDGGDSMDVVIDRLIAEIRRELIIKI